MRRFKRCNRFRAKRPRRTRHVAEANRPVASPHFAKRHARVVIVGAGAAGLAVACALADRGMRDMLVLDAKPMFTDDRTWCWWDVDPRIDVRRLASRRWSRWRVRRGGIAFERSAPETPYLCLRSRDYYADAVRRLTAVGIPIRLGQPAAAITDLGDEVHVHTDDGTLACDLAIDSRGRSPHPPTLFQSFFGMTVRAETPAFDPGYATLMDFDVGGSGLVRFMYVLPMSAHEALVEDTVIDPAPAELADARSRIAAYLRERFGCERWESASTERGVLPMGARAPGRPRGARVWQAGTSGGAVRGASGYAFVRMQQQARIIADAVLRGDRHAPQAFSELYRGLDALALAGLASGRLDGARFFATFAARTPARSFARFMCDAARPGDAPAIVGSAFAAFAAAART